MEKEIKELQDKLDALKLKYEQSKQPFKDGDVVEKENRIIKITNLEKGAGYGLDNYGKWVIMNGWRFNKHPHEWKLSTPEKWLEACTKEAVKRGLVEGAYANLSTANPKYREKVKLNRDGYKLEKDGLTLDNFCIMQNGLWATAIPKDKTLEELDKDWRKSDVHYSHDYIKLHPEAYIKAIQNLKK